jgi:hypothetical protein
MKRFLICAVMVVSLPQQFHRWFESFCILHSDNTNLLPRSMMKKEIMNIIILICSHYYQDNSSDNDFIRVGLGGMGYSRRS